MRDDHATPMNLDIGPETAEMLGVLADPLAYRQHLAEAVRELAAEAEVPVEVLAPPRAGRILPVVPPWVTNPAKWVTLSRADRRALERHHRKQTQR